MSKPQSPVDPTAESDRVLRATSSRQAHLAAGPSTFATSKSKAVSPSSGVGELIGGGEGGGGRGKVGRPPSDASKKQKSVLANVHSQAGNLETSTSQAVNTTQTGETDLSQHVEGRGDVGERSGEVGLVSSNSPTVITGTDANVENETAMTMQKTSSSASKVSKSVESASASESESDVGGDESVLNVDSTMLVTGIDSNSEKVNDQAPSQDDIQPKKDRNFGNFLSKVGGKVDQMCVEEQ